MGVWSSFKVEGTCVRSDEERREALDDRVDQDCEDVQRVTGNWLRMETKLLYEMNEE